ncbi:MAG: hypothetical protein AAGA30_10370 [Planctomycetota bacterium]
MARQPRGEYLDPQSVQIVHVISRCVRRAFLCGHDPVSGVCFEHRRQWIQNRLEFLASVFAVDCLTFAVMSKHFHLVLRSRPDIVRSLSDEEIARRWLKLCPPRLNGKAASPTDFDNAMIVNDARRVAELRIRLSDVSWWMRMTTENIVRLANREDGCTGRFWEGRFKAQLLLDEAALLACTMYVDLNPVRAVMAESLESSEFTIAYARINDLKETCSSEVQNDKARKNHAGKLTHSDAQSGLTRRSYRWERGRKRKRISWLSPVEIREEDSPIGLDVDCGVRRASLNGFFPMSLIRYLALLDWAGRQMKAGKLGSIPSGVCQLLEGLGVEVSSWLRLVRDFGRLFKRAVGNSVSLSEEARCRSQKWMQAAGKSCFTTS